MAVADGSPVRKARGKGRLRRLQRVRKTEVESVRVRQRRAAISWCNLSIVSRGNKDCQQLT